MPVTSIKQLRILPPLAIARFGSSPEPLENYTVTVVDPVGFRHINPAPTLIVDDATGAISGESAPAPGAKVAFRDSQDRVKPLAPFLEVWAQFETDGDFEPLTLTHLADLGLNPWDIKWSVRAANVKAFRRTGHAGDRVLAAVDVDFDGDVPELHDAHPLIGLSAHFKPGKFVPLGTIRYIRPNSAFPEIRCRFTPAPGLVYGCRDDDALIVDDVYAGVTSTPAPQRGAWSYPFAGAWDRYWIGAPNTPPLTAPADIFQGHDVGGTKVSDGYLDDTCDGIIEVSITVADVTVTAHARFMSGVPDFAPDSFHVRTISDDIEQMAFGPDVPAPATAAERSQVKAGVEDTLRRAYETVRLMNTVAQNGTQNIGGVADNFNNMPGQETSYGRVMEPVYPDAAAGFANVLDIHRQVLQDALDAADLSGSFKRLRRMRPPDEVNQLGTKPRRRMPAMMRGSDGVELALTWRQIAKLRLAGPPAPEVVAHPIAERAMVGGKLPVGDSGDRLTAATAAPPRPPAVVPLGRVSLLPVPKVKTIGKRGGGTDSP